MKLFEKIFYESHDLEYFYNRALQEAKQLNLQERLIGKISNDHTKWYMIMRSDRGDARYSPIVGGPEKATDFGPAFKWWYNQKNRSYSLLRVGQFDNIPKDPQPPALAELNKYCKLKWPGEPVKKFSLLPQKDVDIDLSQF
jgi:hypothetical protein